MTTVISFPIEEAESAEDFFPLLLSIPDTVFASAFFTALNNGMKNYKGVLLFSSHDHELISTVANRIIYISEDKIIDRVCSYDEFLEKFGSEL